jgi:hypothetical protein
MSQGVVWTAAFLLLGLATTVLVAWALAVWLPHKSLHWRVNIIGSPAEGFVGVREVRRPGMLRRSWRPETFAQPPAWYLELVPRGPVVPAQVAREDRRWGRLPDALERRNDQALASGMEDARGWPFLAMWCGLDPDAIAGTATADPVWGGIEISPRPGNPAQFRALPFMPIGRGMALNTAFYGGIWAGLVAAAWLARRSARRLRGRCLRCGYDVRASYAALCPECGWRRKHSGGPP